MRKVSRGEEEARAAYPILFGGRLKGKHIMRSGQHLIGEPNVDLELVIGYLLLVTKTVAHFDETRNLELVTLS